MQYTFAIEKIPALLKLVHCVCVCVVHAFAEFVCVQHAERAPEKRQPVLFVQLLTTQ